MNCNNCGVEVSNGKHLCDECESKEINKLTSNQKPNNEQNSASKQFKFIRRKHFGRICISHIVTVVNITDTNVSINKNKIIFYIFKRKPIETSHSIMDMSSLTVSRTMDKGCAIFSAIFIVLGIFSPILFIMTALLIWLGIGKELKIKMSNGTVISIPSEFNRGFSKTSDVIDSLVAINKGIVVQQKI
jgi:hypothetical protein